MILSYICIGLAIVAIGLIVFIVASAPVGYEDEDGFHHGEPPEK